MRRGLAGFIRDYKIETRTVEGQECLVLYKVVRMDFGSWYHRGLTTRDEGAYRPGTLVRCRVWDTDRNKDCSSGLHAGSLRFAKRFRQDMNCPEGMHIVEVLVRVKDVVCVPYAGMGKIRCKKLLVLRMVRGR